MNYLLLCGKKQHAIDTHGESWMDGSRENHAWAKTQSQKIAPGMIPLYIALEMMKLLKIRSVVAAAAKSLQSCPTLWTP